MIVYDLQCVSGHRFEGWFDGILAYEEQKEKNLITCPVCNDSQVSKVPATFAIKSAGGEKNEANPVSELEKYSSQLSQFINDNFDNVGCDFAKEALKIHYGATEPRNIRGISTPEEEKTLKEEGIQFHKFPQISTDTERDS